MMVISCLEDSSLRHAIPSDSPFLLLLLPWMSLSFRGFSKAVPFRENHSTATYSQRFHQLCLFSGSYPLQYKASLTKTHSTNMKKAP